MLDLLDLLDAIQALPLLLHLHVGGAGLHVGRVGLHVGGGAGLTGVAGLPHRPASLLPGGQDLRGGGHLDGEEDQ